MYRRLLLLLLCLFTLTAAAPNWAQSRRSREKTQTSRKKSPDRSTSKRSTSKESVSKRTSRTGKSEKTTRTTAKKSDKKPEKAAAKNTGKASPKATAAKKPEAPAKKTAATDKPAPAKAAATPAAPATAAAPKTGGEPSPATGNPLADGDRWYGEQSWAAALKAYRQAVNRKLVPAERRALVDYRIARCYGLTKDWSQATNEPYAVATRYPNTVWDARMRAWLMRVYLSAPHTGWKVGERYFRGEEMPEVSGDARAERVSLHEDDMRKAVLYGEQAKALYEKLRKDLPDTTEEADHAADLARTVATIQLPDWAWEQKWKGPQDPSWTPEPEADLDPTWAPPRKVLQLFLAAERLGGEKQKPLARLAQATWLRGYHQLMARVAVKHPLMARVAVKHPPMGPPEPIPYPYQERDAVFALRSMIQDYPAHPEAEHARLMVGDWLNQDGQYAAALAVYRGLLVDKPESPWAPHAKTASDEITRKALVIESPAPQAPGSRARLELSARNIPVLKFTAQRVKLEEAVKDAKVLMRTRNGFEELFARIGKVAGLKKYLHAEEPVTWEASLAASEPGQPAPAEFAPLRRTVSTPLTKNGAYLVQADGGPVRQAVLLIISDLAVIQIVDDRRAHAMVVNAATGAPVKEASALIRELYEDAKDKEAISAATVTTDADGVGEKALSPARKRTEGVAVFAWKDDRYAFTPSAGYGARAEDESEHTALVYTDRPVYRPGQSVYYRALLAQRKPDQAWKPLAGLKAVIRLYNDQDAVVEEQKVTANRFGSVHGRLRLGPSAGLGQYRLAVAWPQDEESDRPEARVAVERNSGTFWVEEYKKPEFQVTVSPAIPAGTYPRPGEPVELNVTARYYFGAPVGGASVRYRVEAEQTYPVSPFDGRLGEEDQAFYAYWSIGDPDEAPYDLTHGSMELAAGTAVTDAQGKAVIRFKRPVPKPGTKPMHLAFQVVAEVTDASRRTIEGRGKVVAPDTQFDAFLRPRKGFFATEEPLEAEIATQDFDCRPVSATGTVVVLRRTFVDGKPSFKEVHRGPARTDAAGKAVFAWTAPMGGYYELRFESADAWDRRVTGITGVWVAGDNAGESVDPEEGVALVAQAGEYQTGQPARLLAVSRSPEQPLYLTREAGNRLVEKRFVHVSSQSRVLEVPLAIGDAPDILLAVTGVQSRRMFRQHVNLQVRPPDHQLDVRITADREKYKPGEKAVFKVRARDSQGRPVRVECSVGVSDASLHYIAQDESDFGRGLYSPGRGSDLGAHDGLKSTLDVVTEDDQPSLKWPELAWNFPGGLGSAVSGAFNSIDAGAYIVIQGSTQPLAPVAYRNPFTSNYEGSTLGLGLPGAPGPVGMVPTEAAVVRSPVAKDATTGPPPEFTDGTPPPPSIRSNFADTAFWKADVLTDENGEATVTFTWPDNLTRWRATTRGWTEQAQVGEGSAEVETSKELLVRLQAPRFFVERDEIVLSANVHNYTSQDRRVRVALQLEGDTLYPKDASPFGPPQPRQFEVPRADRPQPVKLDGASAGPGSSAASAASGSPSQVRWIDVPAQSEARVDWTVRAERPGEAKVRVLADEGVLSDAVELRFPTYVHGAEKLVVRNGALLMGAGEKPGKRETKLSFDVPLERVPDAGQLVIQVSPSLAATVLDSLPYLVDYPYGCVEQTLSRFLPAVVSAKTLKDLGLELADLRKRAEAEYERRRTAAPALVVAGSPYSSPEAMASARGDLERSRWHAQRNPVYQPAVMRAIVQEGLNRLKQFQNADGGWGWWQEDGSDERMTAYVLQGLLTGQAAGMAGVEVPPAILESGMNYLAARFAKETNGHDLALLGWVLTLDRKRAPAVGQDLLKRAYPYRDNLTAYSQALLALALKQAGLTKEAMICLANLENTAAVDRKAGTCYWKQDRGAGWLWYNNDVETAAMCLHAYNTLSPKHRLAPLVVRWLANNRRGTAWDTTRETAMAVQALIEYVKVHKELLPDYRVTVAVADGPTRTFTIQPESALSGDVRLVIPASQLGAGPRTVTLTREGMGNLYYTASLNYFTLEEGIRGTQGEVRVARRYFRLTRPAEKPGDGEEKPALTTDGYVRSEVRPGERLTSGDLLEVELVLESKNSYEYLVLEDMKPAGCEPVDLRSGTRYGDGLCSNMELRDQKVAFFLTRLPQGRQRISYRLRAEVPGTFHTLPVSGYAMYAPEIRFLSDETILGIDDPKGKP